MREHHVDVLIGGAGLAGVTAAKTLEAYNQGPGARAPLTYAILEAAPHAGGRVQSMTLPHPGGKGIIINPGAQWLHRDVKKGGRENPLLEIAHSLGLGTVHDSMPCDFVVGGKIDEYLPHIGLLKQARTIVSSYRGPDISLAQLFEQSGLGKDFSLDTTFGKVETGAPLHEVSTHDVRELVACNMGTFLKDGVGKFFDRFAAGVTGQIRLNHKIARIRWGNEGVTAETETGELFHAKKMILTVSIGVLKSGAIRFEPELPEPHREQLSHVHMGNFNKVFLVFDQRRLPVNHNTHLDILTRDGDDIFCLANDNMQPLATFFLGGDMAQLSDRNPKLAEELVIRGLADIYGADIRNHIVASHVTQWGADPLVQGGYSRVAIGHHDARKILASPVGDAVFLAGEALGATHPQTGRNWATHMTGAALSGQRAAREALKSLQKELPDFILPLGRSVGPDIIR